MYQLSFCLCAAGIACFCTSTAWAMRWGEKSTDSEKADARRWAEEHFKQAGKGAHPIHPFSFIYNGKSLKELIGNWNTEETVEQLDKARIRRIMTYTDPTTKLIVRCVLTQYEGSAALDWVLYLSNSGTEDTPIIEQIKPLDTRFKNAGTKKFIIHHSLGEHNSAKSFAPVENTIGPDNEKTLVLAPVNGCSSDGHMPFFNIDTGTEGITTAIGWSGQWEVKFEMDENEDLKVQAGQELTHFKLFPGETVRTPRILLLFWKGNDPLRGNNLFRQLMMTHYMPHRNGKPVFAPICASVTNVDPDGSYEGPHIRPMKTLAERGIEVFWSDTDPQQWYPIGFPDGTGTWEPDPVKYPRGLKPIGDAARSAGLRYLLWFEPERVHPGTRIDKEHPEWVMKPKNEWSQLFKLHDEKARKWLTDYIDIQISAAQLTWLRWDFNIAPLDFWRRNDPPDRQGITEIRHIEGLYAMWDELMKRHPGLIIDNCAAGGRRIDLESCMRGLPLWHSDLQCKGPHPSADQLQNGGLFRWIPMHGCGNFAYEPSYIFRSAMTSGNILIASNKSNTLCTADPDTESAVKNTVAIYKKIRPYMQGDFYPLFPHSESENIWYGYQFHRPDMDSGIAILFRREKCPDTNKPIMLHGINPTLQYKMTFEDKKDEKLILGTELSTFDVEITSCPGSAIVYYLAQ